MARELLLGLDLGTTRVGALLVGPDGRRLAFAERPLPARFPAPGQVEQDPDAMWSLGCAVLREALAGAGASACDVAGIGVTTQRATALAWETGGDALAPAIGWQDQRTAERVAALRARGIPYNTQASATKFEWLLGQVPGVRRAAEAGRLRLGNPDAWLTERLTGGAAFVTDPGCAAATGLFSLEESGWSAGACGLFGIDPAWLPPVARTAEVVGETPAALLGAAVPVAARAGDQQAAAFAQGAHAPGEAKLTLGTSAMLDVVCHGLPGAPPAGAWPLALWRLPGTGDAFCVEGSVHTAGATLEWLCQLGVLASADEADRLAAGVASSDGVVLVPAFQGLGTPYMDDAARAIVCGITRGTTRAHLARAAIEGIAQRCADLCEALLPAGDATLPVDGGLSASDRLLQDLADLSARPVERAAELETTALGAALLAGLATGVLPDLASCRAARQPGRRFTPALACDARASARARFRRAVERCRGLAPDA